MTNTALPPRPPLDIMRELERPVRRPRMQEFDVPAAIAAEQRRSTRRQPLPLPPIPPAVAPPRTAGDSAEAGTPRVFPGETAGDAVPPRIGSVLPADNPWVSEAIRLAEKYDLPRDVFLSMVYQESGFNPEARSNKGAYGLTQLMPGTAADLRADRYDPAQNLDAGARYLRQQIDRFGSLPLALAAYNAGPTRVAQAGNQIPQILETQNYVKKILGRAGVEGYAEGGLADLDEKYADGGMVRRPAAAPVPRPSDEDYLSILADRAVGAGEPVAELRSAEGRGFAPMPRSFGEAGERLSAVVRGDVEPTPEEERQINAVRGFTEGPASIRAYHGSPHRFDRFDISKIGTGEGVQMYGRGLYFAEHPDVARGYRDTLSSYITALNQKIGNTNPIDLYSEIERNAARLPSRVAQAEYDKLSALESLTLHGDVLGVREAAKAGQITPEALAWFEKNIVPRFSREGSLYEVNLRTEPERLLDWDIPLSEQSKSVRQGAADVWRANDFARQTGNPEVSLDALMNTGGGSLVRMMSEVDPVTATQKLREAGIPGLRYFDAGSRDIGQGTSNMVMFGDDLIDITRRYAEGGLADLDEKYADGGMVRRPAAAPVPRPSDEDYLSILADRAVGAGEPVAELRSAEGRGFAPMPRSFGEAGQRLSAVVRGDVEPTPEEERQINTVRGFTEGPASIRAYHGSPYRFDRFDISKIGTGEGAQAYGHGLYFAESEPVARYYRDTLTRQHGRDNVWRDALGREFDIARMSDAAEKGDPLGIAASMLRQSKSVQEAIDDVVRYGPDAFSGGQPDYDSALKGLRSLQEAGLNLVPGGHMYEVALHAKPRDFLDWELPLSKQAPEVRESLTRFGLRADPDAARAYDDALLKALYSESPVSLPKQPRDPMGQEIYQHSLRMSPAEATRALREAGIPGTRYLDAGSRGVGGTYNYAIFDPEIIDITRRYAEGGLAELDQKYADGGMVREPATAYDPDEIDRIVQEFAEGGEVEAPAETTINGQEHKLAYITDREAALLKARGGSGRMTKHGIRAYDDGGDGGGGDGDGNGNGNGEGGEGTAGQDAANSEAGTAAAAGGTSGTGAGSTGAGAGDTSESGPSPGEAGIGGMSGMEGMAGLGGMMSSQDPEATQAAANMNTAVAAQEAGRGFGIADTGNVAPTGFNAAPGIAEALGALGRGEIGFGQALGYGVQSAMSPPGVQMGVNVDEIGNQTPAMSVSVPGVIGGLMGLATGAPGAGTIGGMIGNEIGQELGLDPTVISFAHGGLAKLHAKYAGGGSVSAYDPRTVDQLAKQIEAQYV